MYSVYRFPKFISLSNQQVFYLFFNITSYYDNNPILWQTLSFSFILQPSKGQLENISWYVSDANASKLGNVLMAYGSLIQTNNQPDFIMSRHSNSATIHISVESTRNGLTSNLTNKRTIVVNMLIDIIYMRSNHRAKP